VAHRSIRILSTQKVANFWSNLPELLENNSNQMFLFDPPCIVYTPMTHARHLLALAFMFSVFSIQLCGAPYIHYIH